MAVIILKINISKNIFIDIRGSLAYKNMTRDFLMMTFIQICKCLWSLEISYLICSFLHQIHNPFCNAALIS